jgi:hypothetical protein
LDGFTQVPKSDWGRSALVCFDLRTPSLTRVVSQEIIEQATTTLGDPTHGVIAGDYFYYIATSGWSELDQHRDLKPGSKLALCASPSKVSTDGTGREMQDSSSFCSPQ